MIAARRFIERALVIPYAAGRGDDAGADCWGIVELYYRDVLGISLNERASFPAGHGGLQAGFDVARDWQKIDAPCDHCLVVMRAHGFEAGHIGVHFCRSVLHSDEKTGCVFEPLSSRFIRVVTTGYFRHHLVT